MKFRPSVSSGSASMILLSLMAPLLFADPVYNWSGPSDGGRWDDAANWTVSGGPEADSCPIPAGKGMALLPSSDVDRTILMTGFEVRSQSGEEFKNWLRHISIEQKGRANNQLTILSPFRVGNSIALLGEDDGTARLVLDNSALQPSIESTSRRGVSVLRLEVGWGNDAKPSRISVGPGGILEFAGTIYDEGNNAIQINRGNIVLEGGQILLHRGNRKGTSRSVAYSISDSVVIDSGQIDFDVRLLDEDEEGGVDVRLFVGGDFIMNGGHLVNGGGEVKQLWINGGSIQFFEDAVVDRGIQVTLGGEVDQLLESVIALDAVSVRPKGGLSKKTVAVKASGENIGSISFSQSEANSPATLRMGSNLRLRSGAEHPHASVIAPPDGSTVIYEIDTAGHALDLRGNPEPWAPNRPNKRVDAEWRLSGGGVIYCNGVDFSAEGVTVKVAPDTKLLDGNGQRLDVPNQ